MSARDHDNLSTQAVASARSYWHGVYSSFEEAQGSRDVFDGQHWRERLVEKFPLHSGAAQSTPDPIKLTDARLKQVLETAIDSRSGDARDFPIRILDFGGGIGATYAKIRSNVGKAIRLDYRVVERPSICLEGRSQFRGDDEIKFFDSLASAAASITSIDLVLAASSLHYVSDWQGLIAQFASLRPRWLLLIDIPAGNILASFVTLQEYFGHNIPVWFWRLDDLIACCARHDFVAVSREMNGPSHANLEKLPMDGLPENFRIQGFWNLLFEPSKSHCQSAGA
ncbi:MAG: methyltransferase, TIGR04325 family [Rhodobacteraceae bacterium]|nr:methyltransferase, TIGR04325 family [Paracoccaceae bacterium]